MRKETVTHYAAAIREIKSAVSTSRSGSPSIEPKRKSPPTTKPSSR